MQFRNPFETPGSWYKANLHTHSTASDGDANPKERVRQYRERGYDIIALTDHRVTNDVSAFSTDEFLTISGMETHPECPGADVYHFVCLNLPHGFDCENEPDPNARIRMVRDAGGEVIIGHPYWCGHNITHLMPIEGAIGLEVFNGTCTGIGKGYSSVHWDDLLDAGRILPAVAVDDVHGAWDIFTGWTWIKAESLTVESVMDALRTGCYYASTGPVIEDARVVDGVVRVKCSPVREIQFIAQRSAGWVVRSEDEPLTSAELPFSPMWDYVRIEIVDTQGKRAWTNPFFRPV